MKQQPLGTEPRTISQSIVPNIVTRRVQVDEEDNQFARRKGARDAVPGVGDGPADVTA